MEFTWKGKRVCLLGNFVTKLGQVTYNQFCAFLDPNMLATSILSKLLIL